MNYAVILEYSYGSLPILMHQELKYSLRDLVWYRTIIIFWRAHFEFMTRFSTMILYSLLSTRFTAGPNIKWDVLRALRF